MDPIADAKWILRDHFQKTREGSEGILADSEIFVVYFSYIIGGWKCEMASSKAPGYMFQVTHNKNANETYLDVYVKESNSVYEPGGSEITTKDAASRPDIDQPTCPDCGTLMVWSQGRFVCNVSHTKKQGKI